MKHMQILKRAWNILWSYKTLWVFGIILALTSGSGGGNSGGGSSSTHSNGSSSNLFPPNFNFNPQFDKFGRDLTRMFEDLWRGVGQVEMGIWIALAAAVLLFVLVLAVVFTIGRYVSEVALIRMVDQYETSGEKVNWKQGFRLGWHRSAWRLFLINLVIALPLVVIFTALFAGSAMPALLTSLDGRPSVLGIVATVGLVFLIVFLLILVILVISVFYNIVYRECVLQDLGVFAAIREGYRRVRSHLKDVVLMWLILVGIQLGFAIALIPVVLLVLGISLLVGGGAAAGLFFAVQAMASAAWGWIAAAVIGLMLFFALLSLPLLFLGGLLQTYLSTSWTLAYREVAVAPVPEAEALTEGDLPAGDALPAEG